MQYSPLIRLSLAGAIALAPASQAQGPIRLSSAVDLGALVQREGVDLWQGATRLAPSLRLDQRFMRMSLDGSIVGSGQTVILNNGTLDAAFSPAPLGPLRLSVGGRAERLASTFYSPRTVLSMESSLSLTAGLGGAWLGTEMERSQQVDSMGAQTRLRAQPLLRAGLWRQIGGAIVTLSTASRAARVEGWEPRPRVVFTPDSMDTDSGRVSNPQSHTVRDSGLTMLNKRWSEVELGGSWAHGPVALAAAIGARPTVGVNPQAVWGRMSAVAQLSSRVSFIVSAGNDPARIALRIPSTRFATLGFRLSRQALLRPLHSLPVRPSAAAFSLRPVGTNTYVVSIHVPRARTVELSGDFARWKPLALYETSPDVWETTLTLPPGTYRMNLRVDGDQWKAPPGMATVADEFNGTVGIIAVR